MASECEHATMCNGVFVDFGSAESCPVCLRAELETAKRECRWSLSCEYVQDDDRRSG